MCVGQSLYLFVGEEPTAVTWATRASYRVLRGVRQQSSRSVDRECTGRNASEAIEPRQIFGTRMPSDYEVAKATPSKELTLEKIRRGPSAWHVHKVNIETQEIPGVSTRYVAVSNQSLKTETTKHTHPREVRCFRSSVRFDLESRNEAG